MAIDPAKLTLYLITDPHFCSNIGVEQTVEAAVKGGTTMVQLRDKNASTEDRVALAVSAEPLYRDGAVLVINDDVDAAQISDVECISGKGMDVRRRVRLSEQIRLLAYLLRPLQQQKKFHAGCGLCWY